MVAAALLLPAVIVVVAAAATIAMTVRRRRHEVSERGMGSSHPFVLRTRISTATLGGWSGKRLNKRETPSGKARCFSCMTDAFVPET